MSKKKTSYSDTCDAIREKVKKNGTSSYSRTDLVVLGHALLNCPEQEFDIIVKNKDGTPPDVTTSKPVQRYRDSLRPIIKAFGIDKADLDRVQDIPISKEHTEAMIDVVIELEKDYLGTGRKLKFPINSMEESGMEISAVEVPVKVSEPRKIVKDEAGTYTSIPTGKTVTTAKHISIKAGNKIPHWLKKSK